MYKVIGIFFLLLVFLVSCDNKSMDVKKEADHMSFLDEFYTVADVNRYEIYETAGDLPLVNRLDPLVKKLGISNIITTFDPKLVDIEVDSRVRQVCYSNASGQTVIFFLNCFAGGVGGGYRFKQVENKADRCSYSPKIPKILCNKAGICLGKTRQQVMEIHR